MRSCPVKKPQKIELNDSELNHAIWLKLREFLEARLEYHRVRNDTSTTPEATEKIRGQITEIKAILEAVEPREILLTRPKRTKQ